MPRLDDCHPKVVRALEKAGWSVNAKPQRLIHEEHVVFIDVRAAKQTNGTSQQILLAEIKCFPDRDNVTREIYESIGQYLIYQAMLEMGQLPIPLYLAVPNDVFTEIFDDVVLYVVNKNRIKLVIVNLETETIVQWKE